MRAREPLSLQCAHKSEALSGNGVKSANTSFFAIYVDSSVSGLTTNPPPNYRHKGFPILVWHTHAASRLPAGFHDVTPSLELLPTCLAKLLEYSIFFGSCSVCCGGKAISHTEEMGC